MRIFSKTCHIFTLIEQASHATETKEKYNLATMCLREQWYGDIPAKDTEEEPGFDCNHGKRLPQPAQSTG